nr:MAG TPA: hypothetical protein [Caudoviricetes sp.]
MRAEKRAGGPIRRGPLNRLEQFAGRQFAGPFGAGGGVRKGVANRVHRVRGCVHQ